MDSPRLFKAPAGVLNRIVKRVAGNGGEADYRPGRNRASGAAAVAGRKAANSLPFGAAVLDPVGAIVQIRQDMLLVPEPPRQHLLRHQQHLVTVGGVD